MQDLGKNVREEKKEEKGQRLGISSGKKTAAPKGFIVIIMWSHLSC